MTDAIRLELTDDWLWLLNSSLEWYGNELDSSIRAIRSSAEEWRLPPEEFVPTAWAQEQEQLEKLVALLQPHLEAYQWPTLDTDEKKEERGKPLVTLDRPQVVLIAAALRCLRLGLTIALGKCALDLKLPPHASGPLRARLATVDNALSANLFRDLPAADSEAEVQRRLTQEANQAG